MDRELYHRNDDCPVCMRALSPRGHYLCGHRRHAVPHLHCCICADEHGPEDTRPGRWNLIYPPTNRSAAQERLKKTFRQLAFSHPGPANK